MGQENSKETYKNFQAEKLHFLYKNKQFCDFRPNKSKYVGNVQIYFHKKNSSQPAGKITERTLYGKFGESLGRIVGSMFTHICSQYKFDRFKEQKKTYDFVLNKL